MLKPLLVAVALIGSMGCSTGSNSSPAQSGSNAPSKSVSKGNREASPAYRPIANVRQTMLWILDPAADVIWDSAGAIITAEGETDLSPTSDEDWQQVRNSAAVVAETGNLLMMPGRTAGPNWVTYAQALTAAGEVAMAAADARDADALFDAGGEVYQVCRSCHAQYMLPLEETQIAP